MSVIVHDRRVSVTHRPCTTSRSASCLARPATVPAQRNRTPTSTSQSQHPDAVGSNAAAASATKTRQGQMIHDIMRRFS